MSVVKKLLKYEEKGDGFSCVEIDKNGRELGSWFDPIKKRIDDPKATLKAAKKWTQENGKCFSWIVQKSNHNTPEFVYSLFRAVAGPMGRISKGNIDELGSFNKTSMHGDAKVC